LEVPSFSRIIKTIFKEAGYDSNKLTAHSLRHTSNTLLFKSGADLYTVQQHARHSDPKTTEIYIHAVDREKDRSEQNIYNQIFRPGQKDTEEIASEMMQQLSEEDKLKALEFIRKLSSASAVQKVV
jgi:integrase/recombinase XerC